MSDSHGPAECAAHHDLVRDFGCRVPQIVCLCGSTRFRAEFEDANYELTMKGEIVLSVGVYSHAVRDLGPAEKMVLDDLHKRKIDLADRVFVVSRDGYFGESTRSEIAYALECGKPVEFAEEAARNRWLTQ